MDEFVPKTVYHYCSPETFMKIISNATLRATNIRKSNDYMEVVNCIDIFTASMRNALTIYQLKYPDDVLFSAFANDVNSDELIETSIDNESCTYYCVCFSEARDLLSQWRGYADDGTGVAIGFNDAYFNAVTDYCHMKYRPIEYNSEQTRKDLTQYIVNRFRTTHDIRGERLSRADYESTFSYIISSMVYNAVCYKNQAFSEEREWRLIYYPFGNVRNLQIRHKAKELAARQLFYDKMRDASQYEQVYKGITRTPIQFMLRDKTITSYVDLNFKDVLPYCVKEIVLGPKNEMDDLDLRLFLSENGIDLSFTKIVRSASTYR